MTSIALAISYMVWTSLGNLGTSLIGIYVLEEPITIIKSLSLAVIVIAVSKFRKVLRGICRFLIKVIITYV